MSQKDFVLKMIIAYTQHHGYAPNQIFIRDWAAMYREL